LITLKSIPPPQKKINEKVNLSLHGNVNSLEAVSLPTMLFFMLYFIFICILIDLSLIWIRIYSSPPPPQKKL